jgi:hypothetical protein
MTPFSVKNADGIVMRRGHCPADQLADQLLNPGETVELGWQDLPDPTERPSWAYRRQRMYPPLTDLADAIYWKAQGDDTKMAAYIKKVHAIKQTIPKT